MASSHYVVVVVVAVEVAAIVVDFVVVNYQGYVGLDQFVGDWYWVGWDVWAVGHKPKSKVMRVANPQ